MIYTAVQSHGVAVPAFKERGLNLMPAPVGDITISVGKFATPSLLRTMVTQNPGGFLKTQLDNTIMGGNGSCYNSFKRITPSFYFGRPLCSFNIQGINADSVQVLQSIGIMPNPGLANNYLGSPESKDLSFVYGLNPTQGRFNPGAVSPDGYLAYMFGLKGVEAFTGLMKMTLNGTVNMHCGQAKISEITEEGLGPVPFGDRQVMINVQPTLAAQGSKVIVSYDHMQPIYAPLDTSKAVVGDYLDISRSNEFKDGVGFAYFPNMLLPDKDYTAHVFGSLFLGCIGSTQDICHTTWSSLRRGFRNVAVTEGGRILSHLYLGIELARQACTPMTVVHRAGVYMGFYLHGPLTIYHISSVHTGISGKQLALEFKDVNKHAHLIEELFEILHGAFPDVVADISYIQTSRRLADILFHLDMAHPIISASLDTIKEILEELTFDNQYPSITQTTISSFLNFVVTGDTACLKDYPSMITAKLISQVDRVEFGLLMFGPRCPTINYGASGKDKTYQIPKVDAVDPLIAVPQGGSRILKFIPISSVPYGQAVVQWQMVLKSHAMTIPEGRKKKNEFTDTRQVVLQIGASPSFESVWSLVKQAAYSGVKDVKGKGKRRQGEMDIDDEERAGPSKKKRVVFEL